MPRDKQDVVISCTRCTVSVSIGQTTYDSTGRNLICFNCYNKIVRGEAPDKIIQSATNSEKINYTCGYCSFRFSRSATFYFGGHCFNCGKQSVQIESRPEVIMRDRKSLLDY